MCLTVVVGGMAVFIHVSERDPLCARLTSDVDAAVERRNLPAVIEAARKLGWVHRHTGGVDMLSDAAQPKGLKDRVPIQDMDASRPRNMAALPAGSANATRPAGPANRF